MKQDKLAKQDHGAEDDTISLSRCFDTLHQIGEKRLEKQKKYPIHTKLELLPVSTIFDFLEWLLTNPAFRQRVGFDALSKVDEDFQRRLVIEHLGFDYDAFCREATALDNSPND